MKKAILIILTLMLGFNVKAQTSLTEAVDFYSIDDYGREVHLFDILDNGQFVFMYFFFTDASTSEVFDPCIAEAYHHFGDNQNDVYFVGVAPSDDSLAVDGWRETYGVDFPVIHWFTEGSTAQMICEDYGVNMFSTAVLIAPNHEILIDNIWPITSGQNLIDELENAMATIGVAESNENIFNIYPNPASDYVKINSDVNFVNEANIYDMTGRCIKSTIINDANTTINIEDLNQGVYFINVNGKVKKLVVE